MTDPTTSYISPLINLANCMSFNIMVTCFAWTTHRFACSSNLTKTASPASCRALTAMLWNLRLGLISSTISFTNLWSGNLLINDSVLIWYFFFISLKAFIPSSSFSPLLLSALSFLHLSSFLLLSLFSFSHLPHPLGICPFYLLPLSSGQGSFCFMCHVY